MVQHILGQGVTSVWATGNLEYGSNRSHATVFFEGDTIYSYGYHFPMAVKFPWGFLVNGDRYRPTTFQHQADVRAAIRATCRENLGLTSLTIPFTALRSFSLRDIRPVNIEEDREIPRPYCRRKSCLPKPHMHTGHLLGRAVIRIGERYFLSGTDESARNPWESYFLSELPHPMNTITGALQALKPAAVLEAEGADLSVKRQGEWFLIPSGPPPKGTPVFRHILLANRDARRPARHRVTYYARVADAVYVRGTIRHTAREHRMLTLPNWHLAYENTALESFGAGGRID